MPLSSEDSLRLNVLMAQQVKAIRIDEGKMLLYALTAKGEAKITLNPNEKNDRYLKQIRDFLSTKVLGIAGGFPVYISHWNRLGEAKGNNLDKLLLLGEDSATIAVVNSRELTPELATSAWWAYQSADNARSMLTNKSVVDAPIGKDLAIFLLEFLPFEEEPSNMLASIRLVLQADLITEEDKLKLWNKAKTKNTLYLGFLDTLPDQIPEPLAAHSDYPYIKEQLNALIEQKNPYAITLCHLLGSQGQTFVKTAQLAFKRPPNQEVYAALIESIRRYTINLQVGSQAQNDETLYAYSLGLRTNGEVETDIKNIIRLSRQLVDQQHEKQNNQRIIALKEVLTVLPQLKEQLLGILVLSQTSQSVTFPVFSVSSAVGSLMRKKLKPITDEITSILSGLQHFSL
ncbi:MAG: sulfur reduction protein DsrS [Pseudomonadota bacterium]